MTFCKEPKTKVNGIKKERQTKGLVLTFFITQSPAEISDNKTSFIPRSDLSKRGDCQPEQGKKHPGSRPWFPGTETAVQRKASGGFYGGRGPAGELPPFID